MSRLTKAFEFKEVFSRGHRFPGRYFILFIKENTFHSFRIGLAVSKKTGTAVNRNRVKRIYREALRRFIKEYVEAKESQKTYDFVFVGKRECITAKVTDVYEELKVIMSRLREKEQ